MRENVSHSYAELQRISGEWQNVQSSWHDSTTDYFANNFWAPLEDELTDYIRALENLADVIEEVRFLTE